MGKTYSNVRPNPHADIPPGRVVRESTARRFVKAVKKLSHHRERRSLRMATLRELQEAL